MSIADLKKILDEFDNEQFVAIRIHLKENKDYLDESPITVVVRAYKHGVAGNLLLIGDAD